MNNEPDSNADHVPDPSWPPPPHGGTPNVFGERVPPGGVLSDPSLGEQPVVAEVVPRRPQPPRIWPALIVGIVALPVSWFVSGVVLGVGALLYYGPDVFRPDQAGEFPEWIGAFCQTRVGLLVVILPSQLIFLAASVGAALLSPEPLRQRLGLRPGVLPYWTWAVLALATPVVGFGSSVLLSLLVDEPSEQLRLMSDMMRTHAQGGFVVVLSLLVIGVPGIVEELLFRGYLQSRLLRRWPPVAAIALSTLLFAAAHMDPLHVVGVMPLGIWLGVVAWRTGSVWPAVLCHASNNAVALVGAVYGDPDVVEITFDTVTVASLSVGVPAMLLSLGLLAFARPTRSQPQVAAGDGCLDGASG